MKNGSTVVEADWKQLLTLLSGSCYEQILPWSCERERERLRLMMDSVFALRVPAYHVKHTRLLVQNPVLQKYISLVSLLLG